MALSALATYLLAASLPLVLLVDATPVNLLDSSVHGSAIPPVERRVTTTTRLTAAQELSYKPAALFASAAYCRPTETINWSCGGQYEVQVKLRLLALFLARFSTRISGGRASKRPADSR